MLCSLRWWGTTWASSQSHTSLCATAALALDRPPAPVSSLSSKVLGVPLSSAAVSDKMQGRARCCAAAAG